MFAKPPSTPARELPFSQMLYEVLNNAKAEAHRLGDGEVRPEHVLVALLVTPSARRARLVLEGLRIEPDRVRDGLAPTAAHAPDTPRELPWNRRAKAILGRIVQHSRGRGRCSSEDLLLAIAEGKGLAAELLRWLGAAPERIREAAAALPEATEE